MKTSKPLKKEEMQSIQTPEDIRSQEIRQRSLEERKKRLNSIENPVDMNELIADLKWISEKGVYEDLDLLFNVKRSPKFSVEALALVTYAIKCISDRDIEEREKSHPSEILQITTPLAEESDDDRKQRIEKVRNYAIEVFESIKSADSWLSTPRSELDQKTPMDFLITPRGAEIVESMLGRIEYGVYS